MKCHVISEAAQLSTTSQKLAFDFIYTSTNIKHKVAVLRGEFQQVTFFNKCVEGISMHLGVQ